MRACTHIFIRARPKENPRQGEIQRPAKVTLKKVEKEDDWIVHDVRPPAHSTRSVLLLSSMICFTVFSPWAILLDHVEVTRQVFRSNFEIVLHQCAHTRGILDKSRVLNTMR
uniref:Uncharacterized protein n=1 Tax=Odontella aurita TaxID=265563 RepID=A0A6U6FE07_9STRA|mmetsp:Transcript_33906/g.101140  ORF Transcript_33906/g.101140 Transcript_33906/m.101140 type:complete len:112 (+) Transcript_33906:1995-2330(+)